MASGQNIGSLFWTSGIDTSGLKRDSKKASGALSGLFNPAMLGAAAVGAALLKVGSAALDFSRDFETAFAEVQTISEEARNSADSMKESILEMTTEIPVGAVEATKALYQIVSAGYAGADAMNVLEISAKAATAGSSTTAIAADTLTTIMNSYGMSADEAMNASDMLFKTVEMGKTTLNEIGASFSQVASMAAAYGVELNESLAATAAVTKLGTPTAEAMTQMKAAIIAVTKSLGENIFKTMSFGDAMVLARRKADESGEGLQKYFGSVEAVNFVLKTTGENTDAYAESLDGLTKSAGATEDALAIMEDTLEGQEKLLKNNINNLLSDLGDTLNEFKKDILPGLNKGLQVLADDSIPLYAKALAGLANAVNIPALFGGDLFTAEQFGPEIMQMKKAALREVEAFKKRTSGLSDDEFKKEVERIKKAKEYNKKTLRGIQSIKEKYNKVDEEKEKEARQAALSFYNILEFAEGRLARKRKETPPPGGGKDAEIQTRTGSDIDEDIEKTQAAFDEAHGQKMDNLAEVLVALREEKAAWDDLHDAAMQAAREVFVPEKIKPITGTGLKVGVEVEEITAANLELKKLKKWIKENTKEGEKLQGELDFEKAAEKKEALTRSFFDIADSAYFLSQSLRDSNSEIAGMLSGVAELSSSIGRLNDLGAFSEGGMSNKDALSMGIEGATKLVGMVASQTAENKKVMEEYYASIIKQQSDYNLLLNDQILMGDKIGPELYTDYESRLDTGTKAFIDANDELNEGMKGFLTNEAVVGKENAISGKNILSGVGAGAAVGAAVGSVVPVVGTLVGGIVGGIAGGITGLFSKKKKDVVKPLLEKYPELIKANGQFNASLAKTLVGTDLVTDKTDAALQNMIAWSDAADAAREQIVGVIEDIVGGIGNDLNNALVTAFEDGTDAAIAMGEVLNDVLENYISQLIFAATMGPYLDKLTEDMFASVGLNPEGEVPDVAIDPSIADGSFADDIGRFYDSYGEGVRRYNESMEEAQEAADERGMDIFQPDDKPQTGLSGSIRASLTEDTGSLLAGIWRRHLDETINHTSIMDESNSYLSTISENTLRTAVACEALAGNTNQDGRDLGV